MSRRSDEYLRGVPQKPYDLIREGLIALGFIAIVVIALAIAFASPSAPTVTGESVAKNHPLDYMKTVTDFLSGDSALQTYGPPYTRDTDNLMKVLGFAPATILGTTRPLDAQKDLVIAPLERVALLNKDVDTALKVWKGSTEDQQKAWTKAYGDALDKAEEANGEVKVAAGDYGPVPVHGLRHADARPGRICWKGPSRAATRSPTPWIIRRRCSSSRRDRIRTWRTEWTCWERSGGSPMKWETFRARGGCGPMQSGTSSP